MLGSFISLAENQSSIALLSWQRGNSLIGNPIGAHFSLDLLHMTRTANPHADMLLLLQSQQVLDSNPAYAKRLQEIGVSVHFRENLTSPGSRSAKYARLHAAANFQGMPDMESRFCEWADLALLYKLDRVLTLDSDAAAFEDVNQVFLNYTEDIISPCSQCSQVVLWRTSALSHFCDAYIEYVSDLLGGNNTFHQFYGTGTYFNDMAFLNIYVHERWLKVNNESYAFLTENASVSPRNPNPRAWDLGHDLSYCLRSEQDI